MPFLTALATIAGSVLAGSLANDKEDKVADAQIGASDRAQQTMLQMFNESNRLQEPFRQGGMAALNQRNALLGLPQVSDQGNGGGGYGLPITQPATQPVSGVPERYSQPLPQGFNAQAYLDANPDLVRAMSMNPAWSRMSPEQFATMHYNANGQYENRPGTPGFTGPGQATPQGGQPSVVGVGGGAFQQGGTPGNALAVAGQPTPANTIAQGQNDAYDVFLNSGQARSMLETTNNDFNQMVGAFGAGGTSLSGSAIGALNDRNRRNTNTALQQYDNALAGISNTGQATATNQANSAINTGNNLADQENYQGRVRGTSYGNQQNLFGTALQSAAGMGWS